MSLHRYYSAIVGSRRAYVPTYAESQRDVIEQHRNAARSFGPNA